MLAFALVFPLIVAVAIIALALAKRGPFRVLAIVPTGAASAESANRRVRLRNFTAIAAAVLSATSLAAGGLLGSRTTEHHGPLNALHLFLLTPILTAVVIVAFFAFVPTFRETSDARTAELNRRTPLSFGPRSVFLLPVVAASLLVILIVVFGVIADSGGRMFSYSPDAAQMGTRGGGFPGFAYGGPILAGVAIFAGVIVIALRHIASAPRPSDTSLREADSTVRLLGIRVVMKTATSALALTIASLLVFAGSTTSSMTRGTSLDADGNTIPADATLQTIGMLGSVSLWLSIIFIVAAIVFMVGALGDATRKPFESTPVTEVVA